MVTENKRENERKKMEKKKMIERENKREREREREKKEKETPEFKFQRLLYWDLRANKIKTNIKEIRTK